MPVQLLIGDGAPYWYLSPDIWVVPGNDPAGAAGSPVAGLPAYLWARVHNNGDADANGVHVDFYWANPALQVTRSNATFVGSANTDVPAGGTQEVLCLVPWVPTIVNGGHECLVAVANHVGHPLPSPLPDAFEPPTYPQVAQKNLTVLGVKHLGDVPQTLTISGWRRVAKSVVVTAEVGGELDAATLAGLGLGALRPARAARVEVGLSRERRRIGEDDPIGEGKLELELPRGTSRAIYVSIRAVNLGADEYQLVQIVERGARGILGGLAYLVVAEHEERRP